MAVVILALTGLTIFATQQQRAARIAEDDAEMRRVTAVAAEQVAEEERVAAVTAEAKAVNEARIARAGQLAAQSQTLLSHQTTESLLLALESLAMMGDTPDQLAPDQQVA